MNNSLFVGSHTKFSACPHVEILDKFLDIYELSYLLIWSNNTIFPSENNCMLDSVCPRRPVEFVFSCIFQQKRRC